MRRLSVAILSVLGVGSIFAQTASSPASARLIEDENIPRLVGHSFTSNGAMEFLETFTDTIGGRITGSPGSRQAAELILRTLKAAGYENARAEEYELPSVWRHGPTTGEVISPVRRALVIGSYGWVPGTEGPIEVSVTDFGPAALDTPASAFGRFRDTAVIADLRSSQSSTAYVGIRQALAEQLAGAGAAALLIVSDKPNRMVHTSAFGFYPRGPLPVLSIASEDAGFLRRLIDKGPVKVRIESRNSFDSGPGVERNVIADLKGEEGREVVLLLAHFDDWDLAQGANDNGTGVAVILEAARVFKRLGIRPRHTIRFAFVSGEEQFSNGSRAYIERHRDDLDATRAVFNVDVGANPATGFRIHGRTDMEAASRELLKPLAPLGANGVFLEADLDGDHDRFILAGIPAYSLYAGEAGWGAYHHTALDTFERVDPLMVRLQTAIMAVAAYSFANADQRPGPRLDPAQVQDLLKRTGLEPLYKLLYEKAAQ